MEPIPGLHINQAVKYYCIQNILDAYDIGHVSFKEASPCRIRSIPSTKSCHCPDYSRLACSTSW